VGFVEDDTDCNDFDRTVNPGAPEVCDGQDNDCDGLADEDAVDQVTWYTDADNDGFGDEQTETTGCTQPPGTVLVGGDCDDGRASVNPGASEVCDADDNNCDGLVDDGPNTCPCPIEHYDGRGYAFCELDLPWDVAEPLCAAFGYEMVSISDADENSFVLDAIASYDPSTDWWIGFTDDAVEGLFRWSDGTPVTYENWEPGQPNDFFGQDCAEIDAGDGLWNDESCLFTFQPYVCESP
jgi:hypothetical protein